MKKGTNIITPKGTGKIKEKINNNFLIELSSGTLDTFNKEQIIINYKTQTVNNKIIKSNISEMLSKFDFSKSDLDDIKQFMISKLD